MMDEPKILTNLCQTTIDHEFSSVYKRTFIAREKQHSLSLFDSFAKTTSWEVYLAPFSFLGVIAKPVLQQRGTKDIVRMRLLNND